MEQIEQKDLFDRFFDKLKLLSKPIGLILLMLLWQVFGIVVLKIFGIDYKNLSDLSKILFSLGCDLSFIVLLIILYFKDLIREFKGYFNRNIFKNIKMSFDYWVVGLVIMIICNFIISIITNGGIAGNEEAVRNLIDKFPLYMTFQVMLYAPFVEEMIFRKSFKDAISNKFLFILISGITFGGLHVVSSVSSLVDLLYLFPYCSLGIVFAYLYTKTNNIFSTIVIHSFHNTLAIVLYLFG